MHHVVTQEEPDGLGHGLSAGESFVGSPCRESKRSALAERMSELSKELATLRQKLPSGTHAGVGGADSVRLVRVGLHGNVLVRSDGVQEATSPGGAGAVSVPSSSREMREEENAQCAGGMRSPWRAVRRSLRCAAREPW